MTRLSLVPFPSISLSIERREECLCDRCLSDESARFSSTQKTRIVLVICRFVAFPRYSSNIHLAWKRIFRLVIGRKSNIFKTVSKTLKLFILKTMFKSITSYYKVLLLQSLTSYYLQSINSK